MSAQRHKEHAKLGSLDAAGAPSLLRAAWQGRSCRFLAGMRGSPRRAAPRLPRFFFHRLSQFFTQPIKLAVGLLDLAIDEPHAFNEAPDVSTRGLNGTRRDRTQPVSQSGQHLCRIEAADAAILEEFGNRTLANTRRFVGGSARVPKDQGTIRHTCRLRARASPGSSARVARACD